MNSPGRWILFGLLAAGAGLAWGLIPHSETYYDSWGFSNEGRVDVNCGSAFSGDVDPYFHDWEEGQGYRADLRAGYDAPIFGGQTATEVCEELTSGPRTVAIAGLAGGALLALVGMVGAAGSNGPPTAASHTSPAPPAPSGGSAPPPPPPPPPSAPSAQPLPASASPVVASSPHSLPPEPTEFVAVPALAFHDGRHVGSSELHEQVVIGREPTRPADAASAVVIAVVDPTVSKTHLRAGITGEDVWIEDLHSRNGVSVVAPGGDTMTAAPGQRVILDVGDEVIVGDSTRFTVIEQSSTASGGNG